MQHENSSSQVAARMLHALLLTGDGSAATLVLEKYVATFPPLPDEQFLAEMQRVMDVYSILLDRLDVIAAAKRPEFLGLRKLIKRVIEEKIKKERQTT
jgi:hypothetical protein